MISDDQDGVKHWLWNHQWYVGEEENVSPVINAMLKYQLVWKISTTFSCKVANQTFFSAQRSPN